MAKMLLEQDSGLPAAAAQKSRTVQMEISGTLLRILVVLLTLIQVPGHTVWLMAKMVTVMDAGLPSVEAPK
jgi:hypothetical protein